MILVVDISQNRISILDKHLIEKNATIDFLLNVLIGLTQRKRSSVYNLCILQIKIKRFVK